MVSSSWLETLSCRGHKSSESLGGEKMERWEMEDRIKRIVQPLIEDAIRDHSSGWKEEDRVKRIVQPLIERALSEHEARHHR
jgi:hypothetical protein